MTNQIIDNQQRSASTPTDAGVPAPTNAELPYQPTASFQILSKSFQPDIIDGVFALATFALGFFYIYWVMVNWQGWGVALFTLMYVGTILVYFRAKKTSLKRESWFWLTVVLLTGLSFALWNNNGLYGWPILLLFASAVYWVVSANGAQIKEKTSDWLVFDGINAFMKIPILNFMCTFQALKVLNPRKSKGLGKQSLSVMLGLFMALLVIAIALPLLMNADSGGFAKLTKFIGDLLAKTNLDIVLIFRLILSILTGAYIFGLTKGCVYKQGTDSLKANDLQKNIQGLRILPEISVYIMLGLVCALYLLFMGSQLPYFFSAFARVLPTGYQAYAEYARSGFFELCQIATLNLVVLLGANLMIKGAYEESRVLKIYNIVLATLTLFLICTALSKMGMYIGVYGLSMRRLLPCVFMVFMIVVYSGVIARQKWSFSVVRLSLFTGVLLICLLCLSNSDRLVADYNASRYLNGSLVDFDVLTLYQAGPAGVNAAQKIYAGAKDPVLKEEVGQFLAEQQRYAQEAQGKMHINWETSRILQ